MHPASPARWQGPGCLVAAGGHQLTARNSRKLGGKPGRRPSVSFSRCRVRYQGAPRLELRRRERPGRLPAGSGNAGPRPLPVLPGGGLACPGPADTGAHPSFCCHHVIMFPRRGDGPEGVCSLPMSLPRECPGDSGDRAQNPRPPLLCDRRGCPRPEHGGSSQLALSLLPCFCHLLPAALPQETVSCPPCAEFVIINRRARRGHGGGVGCRGAHPTDSAPSAAPVPCPRRCPQRCITLSSPPAQETVHLGGVTLSDSVTHFPVSGHLGASGFPPAGFAFRRSGPPRDSRPGPSASGTLALKPLPSCAHPGTQPLLPRGQVPPPGGPAAGVPCSPPAPRVLTVGGPPAGDWAGLSAPGRRVTGSASQVLAG